MKKTEPKKHHFVPKTYLKNFATRKNDDYYVSILHKDEPEDKISEKNIADLCAVNHLSKPDGNHKLKLKLEDIYTDIFENHYDKLFSVLTDDKILEITDQLKNLLFRRL